MMGFSADLVSWMTLHASDRGFQEFMAVIKTARLGLEAAALQPGDTEIEKVQALALKMVESLPEEILNALQTDDTTETSEG